MAQLSSTQDIFLHRHLGHTGETTKEILNELGFDCLENFSRAVVPSEIWDTQLEGLPQTALGEGEALKKLWSIFEKNEWAQSLIGQGYYGTITPPVIQRQVLENPGWYTAYTPYQAEISQGRLEILYHFQTLIVELTGLAVANASLLDEGTAVAEAIYMAQAFCPKTKRVFIDELVHPQTLEVVKTRAKALGWELIIGQVKQTDFSKQADWLATVFAYPNTQGEVIDYSSITSQIKEQGGIIIAVADPLALTLLTSPASWGADICVGSCQRFGVPMGFGGPHAAFIACIDKFKRKLPGRIVGLSVDANGKPAYRLALQTREQHIRKAKATSNICTAQVLLAVMATLYAIYHGPEGLRRIANRIHLLCCHFSETLQQGGYRLLHDHYFDTIVVETGEKTSELWVEFEKIGYNLRKIDDNYLGLAFDETITLKDLEILAQNFGITASQTTELQPLKSFSRQDDFLTQEIFHLYRSETELMRYLKHLENKDLSLTHSMIPLGSCTMKLNPSASMLPLSWPKVAHIHPFAPAKQCRGYKQILEELETWLAAITGFAGASLQPNAGSQGEYAGLLAIRSYLKDQGQPQRNICLIPVSAHGTNPASAVLAGLRVVGIACDDNGNIDKQDLKQKLEKFSEQIAVMMITYPSTHGVFEEGVVDICQQVHSVGGQVYLDGANLNAQIGLTHPRKIGADVCHLNLHKTFCIPHGGGGPGVGPIAVANHLTPYLPGHINQLERKESAVSSAPWGSASIATIPWMYIAMMGKEGLQKATQIALLNANLMAKRLDPYFPVLYKGKNGLVAHECLLDFRDILKNTKLTVEDIAKRLIDYGFHAPTMNWPVTGTLMLEPTESESLAEIERFCQAMISIYGEIRDVINRKSQADDNVIINAPHTVEMISSDEWNHSYSRQQAAYPLPELKRRKFWSSVARVDNVHGDRYLVCSCPPITLDDEN